ncbi:MAG: hypothetical protein IJ528_06865 [Bacteroidaceae bacterium]|nr:hypothetical protein [Bacteroidaceae bacterium]
MKKLLLSILLAVIGLSAFSQSPSKLISMMPSYPLTIGESTSDDVMLSSTGLLIQDIVLDSLPSYEIGYIDEQSFLYTEDGYGFYIKADSLHSTNVVYSYEVNEQPQGEIHFDAEKGLFVYYPTANEYDSFQITFTATNGTESVSEVVDLYPMPLMPSNVDIFSSRGVLPDAGDYTVIAESSTSKYLNNQTRTSYSISISGKDVIFDDALHNKVWGLNGREDIYELNIYAERLIVRSRLAFPETYITVYAKELIFEDRGNVISCINTTPMNNETLTDGNGSRGAYAGHIDLYVKEIKYNSGKRLIANGANGQSTNRNGTPGIGGNGGQISSTVDVESICDFARGSGGVKYDVAADGSTNKGPIIEHGANGSDGAFHLINSPYAYLHPYYIAAVLRYANDAYINNCIEEVYATCTEYETLLNGYLNPTSAEGGKNEGIKDEAVDGFDDRPIEAKHRLEAAGMSDFTSLELENNLMEIEAILFRLGQGLDYFGNPDGWVPLMSFEVFLENYKNEIDRAIPTLYMYYWLNRIDQTLQNQVSACQFAADATEQDLDDCMSSLNQLTLEVPVLQDEAERINSEIITVTTKIEKLQKQLLRKAKHNVRKRNRLKKIFGVVKAVANVIPIIGPVGTAISKGINETLTLANNISSLVGGESFNQFYQEFDNTTLAMDDSFSTKVETSLLDIKNGTQQFNLNTVLSASNSLIGSIQPLASNINKLQSTLSKSSTPKAEVQQELNKLMAKSKTWKSLQAQIMELNARKEKLLSQINQVFSAMTTTMADINNNALALDAFRRDAFTGNSKRDLNAMLYLESMEQKAKNRLQLYSYYLRKAYEYRLLKPYESEEFNLVGMFERFEKLGLALDSVVNQEAYDALSNVFKETISEMTERIVNEYTMNLPEQSTSSNIIIPKDQLDVINAGNDLTINFHEMGVFPADRENVRIVGVDVLHMKSHVNGNVGQAGSMELNFKHSGTSTFRKDGNLYWFNHISQSTTNPHTWSVNYDALGDVTSTISPSAANSSLLSSILGLNTDIMFFSRPSAWSDITVSKNVNTVGGGDIVIDSLVIRLQYDFTRRPDNIRNIDIATNDGWMPYIECSTEDINGRSSGNGRLYRSFRAGNQPVTFTAADRYETYRFKEWTDRAGNVVSNNNSLTVTTSKDQFYIANYEQYIPVLDVPDTIRVSYAGGTQTVNVRNSGLGDIEMDWEVSDSLSTWVKLNGDTEGIDDGTFSFTFSANETASMRLDSLEIFASETDELSKVIYILQEIDMSKFSNVVYVDKTEAVPGQRIALPIQIRNDRDVAGVSMTLCLPKGMTLAKDADGDIIYQLNSSRVNKSKFSVYWAVQADGSCGFRIMPNSTATINGTEGVVLTVMVDVDTSISKGDHTAVLKQNSFTIKDSNGTTSTLGLPDTQSTISVIDVTLGDVNSDGRVDLTDAIMIVYSSLGMAQTGFVTRAADVNSDGRIDLTDAIIVVYKSLGVEQKRIPKRIINHYKILQTLQ